VGEAIPSARSNGPALSAGLCASGGTVSDVPNPDQPDQPDDEEQDDEDAGAEDEAS